MDGLEVSVRVTEDIPVLDDDRDLQRMDGGDASTRLMLSATGSRAGGFNQDSLSLSEPPGLPWWSLDPKVSSSSGSGKCIA